MTPDDYHKLGKQIRKTVKEKLDSFGVPEAAQSLLFGFISDLSKAVNEPDTVQAELIQESEKERFEKARKIVKENKK